MPYDKNLDQQLYSVDKILNVTKFIVSIFSYNEGQKKIQISRETQDSDGNWRFAKLGRLTKEEAEIVTELIQKALQNF